MAAVKYLVLTVLSLTRGAFSLTIRQSYQNRPNSTALGLHLHHVHTMPTLAGTSYADIDGINNSCANRSLCPSLEFNIVDFSFHSSETRFSPSSPKGHSWGHVSFKLSNTAVQHPYYSCEATKRRKGDVADTNLFSGWDLYGCQYPKSDPVNITAARGLGSATRLEGAVFSYDSRSGALFVAQKWACRDESPWE